MKISCRGRSFGLLSSRIRFVVFLTLAFGLGTGAGAQEGAWNAIFHFTQDSAEVASGKSLFEIARPDVIVQVKKHRLSGADMFEITAVSKGYPPDLLQKQVESMCSIVGVPPRGLVVGKSVVGTDANLSSTLAKFATDGFIDDSKGTLHITPIIQAFAGAPEPYTIRAMTILFNGETPGANVLKSYSSPGVRVQAVAYSNPATIEYRVQLLSQDPKMLTVPDEARKTEPEQKPASGPSSVQQNGVDWSLWIPLVLAGLAAGFLVYFLMLRSTTAPRR